MNKPLAKMNDLHVTYSYSQREFLQFVHLAQSATPRTGPTRQVGSARWTGSTGGTCADRDLNADATRNTFAMPAAHGAGQCRKTVRPISLYPSSCVSCASCPYCHLTNARSCDTIRSRGTNVQHSRSQVPEVQCHGGDSHRRLLCRSEECSPILSPTPTRRRE